MYTKELETLYELIIAKQKLTPSTLSSVGITPNTLENMLNEGLIYQLNTEEYHITSINKLFLYGKKLLANRRKRDGNNCIEICYEMAPNNRDICLQLFLHAIIREDYEDTIKYFEDLERINPIDYRIDHNIYLYFINLVNKLPDNYNERIESIKSSHHSLDYRKPNKEQSQINNIMYLVKKGKYKLALTKLNDLIASDFTYSTERLILKQFLIQAISLEKILKEKIILSANKHAYETIIFELDRKRTRRKLRNDEEDVYKVAKQLIHMNETNEIPQIIATDATTVSEAIKFQDYETALILEESFIEYSETINKKQLPEPALYILLRQINDRIRRYNFATNPNDGEEHPRTLIYKY